ncbi:MAG: histidine ammonia-lyase [Bacteroidota bacterium]
MFFYGKDHLTSQKALAILRGQLPATIDEETEGRINQAHQEILAIADSDAPVYGINTGFGPLCNTRISKSEMNELQRRLLISHSVGVGQPIAPEMAKLMLILKVHAIAQGFSGLSMEVINRILWHIDHEVIPVVPEQGSVGASGDLAPLSHLFLPLIGEGEVWHEGTRKATQTVLKQYGLTHLNFDPKTGLGLINGTQFIAAHAVFLVESLHNLLAHADIIAAMMVDGMKGSKMPFHPNLHETRPFKGNIHVAARIWRLLDQSEILISHLHCDRVQDPYSLRCVPQVHGASRNAWLHLKEAVEVEINSVTDNPVIFSRDLSISGGNFHGQPLALPIDYACLAAHEIGNISDRRSYLSLEGKLEGTPKLLLHETGLNSGFMILQYTGAALVSENKGLCFPASADSIPTSLGQEDHVSMGSIGARKALRVCENVERVLAIELICAAQAIDFKRPLLSGPILENVLQEFRKHVTFATEDRLFAKDIEVATQLIRSGSLVHIVDQSSQEIESPFEHLFEQF